MRLPEPKLEQVYKLSGVPTYTFVRPREYGELLVALRTPGRGVVIEGPSGIGKTSAVVTALRELGLDKTVLSLSARHENDIETIRGLPSTRDRGIVIVDDFHRLDPDIRSRLADWVKSLADEEREDTKCVLVGINRAGESLVRFAEDVYSRLTVIRFEANPDSYVKQLVEKGEEALNIELEVRDQIVKEASGSFFIAQMLCHTTCLSTGVLEREGARRALQVSFEGVRSQVYDDLSPAFLPLARTFATGPRLRPEGRAPYLHILRWLSEAEDWTVDLDRSIATHPLQRVSVGQIIEKGYLQGFLASHPELSRVVHFDPSSHIIAVEDPRFVFFLRNIAWNSFAREVGFLTVRFPSRYDFALSFSGTDRPIASALFDQLSEMDLQVFYDRNEQHRIAGEDVERYLGPIYRSEAAYVVCILGPDYPNRVWTAFESEQFKHRFATGSVIPVFLTTTPPGTFQVAEGVGRLEFNPTQDLEPQISAIANVLRKKMEDYRIQTSLSGGDTNQ